MAKKKSKAKPATKRKTTKRRLAGRSRQRPSGFRITGEFLELSGARIRLPDPRTAAICGAACTCDGVGCQLPHPRPGLHCQFNPTCPNCTGTCILAVSHETVFPAHACSHGHTF